MIKRLTSAIKTPSAENNVARGRLFLPRRERKNKPRAAVVVLPQWNAQPDSHVEACRIFNGLGMTALRLTLPYHEERRPPELERAEHLVSSNIGRTIQSMRQAVLDTRAAVSWLKGEGYERVGILGTSVGSCIAFLAFAHEPALDAGAFNHVSGYVADVVWHGLSTQHVREGFGDHLTLDELRQCWAPVSPLPFIPSPNKIVWSVDGMVYHTVTPANLPAGTTWVFNNSPAFIILDLAGGNLFLTIAYTAIAVWILGLAMPVTASYIIAAVITAPAMIKLGIPAYAAHMFIFYYAVLSEVSPPTALSPFAAAAITGGDPYKTTLQSWKYTLPAFLVPFVFVLDPQGVGLLLSIPKGGSWVDIVEITIKTTFGLLALAAFAQNWALRQNTPVERGLLLLSGLLLVFPSLIEAIVESIIGRDISYTYVPGLIIGLGVVLWQARTRAPTRPALTT